MRDDIDIESAVVTVLDSNYECLSNPRMKDRLSFDTRGFVYLIMHKRYRMKVVEIQRRYNMARRTVFNCMKSAAFLVKTYRKYRLAYEEMLRRCEEGR